MEQKIIELESRIIELENHIKDINENKITMENIWRLVYEKIRWWIKIEDSPYFNYGIPTDLRPKLIFEDAVNGVVSID